MPKGKKRKKYSQTRMVFQTEYASYDMETDGNNILWDSLVFHKKPAPGLISIGIWDSPLPLHAYYITLQTAQVLITGVSKDSIFC